MKSILRLALAIACLCPLACGGFHRSRNPEDVEARGRANAAAAAVDALHDTVKAPKSDITVVAQEDVTWNDSCLGCAKTGESCKQVLMPGYRVNLRIRDASYEYHTDRGGNVRICNQGVDPASPASGN